MRLPIEIAQLRRRANFDANEIGMPVNGPIGTLDSDEPWMRDHFTQENFEQLQEAQMGGELGPALDLTKQAAAPKTVMDLIRAKAMSYARDYFADHPEHLEDADGYAPDLAQAALYGFSSRDTAGVSKSVAREIAADAIVDYAESVSRGRPIRLANLEDACWEDYEAIGMKEKDGRMVPNCVPVRKARFHEGPEGTKEFEDWMDDQPEDFQEEWESNTDEYGDQFKKARFHEGPEGTKEFEDWMDDQPEDFKEEWESNTEEYGDQFKKAGIRGASANSKAGALEALMLCEGVRWPTHGTLSMKDPSSFGAWIIVNPSKRKAYSVHTSTLRCEEFDFSDVMDAYGDHLE
jgi:hypothetical protein